MLRAAWLSAQNDGRLLVKDPVVLLMLLLAPVVIITVAGYSLGALYGGTPRARVVPVVDHDGGEVAAGVLDALRAEPSVRVEPVADLGTARRMASAAEGPPLAIEIPAGTSAAIRAGRSPRLVLYVDPAKRLETNAIEVRLGELVRRVGEEAQGRARARLDAAEADLRRDVAEVTRAIDAARERIRDEVDRARVAATDALRAQLAAAAADASRRIEARIHAREAAAWGDLEAQLAARRARVEALRLQLRDVEAGERAFVEWLGHVRELAGRHAADLPPPPPFPALPSEADLAELARPLAPPAPARPSDLVLAPPVVSIVMPAVDAGDPPPGLDRLRDLDAGTLPGTLGLAEEAASPGADVVVNAFDQYVPGFGVTFLLIGMMLGIALTLVDERTWGTLERLEASGASASGVLLGKLLMRFAVGVVQMIVLFAVGRALFGISLGRAPLALLLPTVGIAFAAAGLGLVMPSLAGSHDSVMPLGTMTSMAMSAIGGCWWPIDFEPPWMRMIARGLPTTWAMQAYNDLMIRRAPWSAAVWPSAVAVGLGLVYVVVGIATNMRRPAAR